MKYSNQVALLVAAAVIAGAVTWGTRTVTGLLERQNDEIALLRLTVAQFEEKLSQRPDDSQQTRRMQAAEQIRSNESQRHAVETTDSPQLGPSDAVVTIVEFSDFECPYCRRAFPTMNRIRAEYEDQVRIVFKHYPLNIHPNAMAAHIAAEAAHRQGKFWEMHDLIFSGFGASSSQTYEEYAERIGLDVDRFRRDIASESVQSSVRGDADEARRLGVRGTPGFFVNGVFVSGARPFESFKRMIDQEISAK